MRPIPLILAFIPILTWAQNKPQQESRHGWHLSPHGTIRILVLFAEIDHDRNPDQDPQPDGATHWPKGQLPRWKDDLFDPQPLPVPQARISRYYHDASLGNFVVLGDYVDRILTLRESEYHGLQNAHGINAHAIQEANKLGSLRTRHRLGAADFDQWKRGGRPGLPKEAGPDDPHSYDHIMVIIRNSTLRHGQGSVDAGSSGKLFGYESDTQSRFGGMNALPHEILQHEFNHLLFGGNNFHVGGGNAASFTRHFICMQGGWSMMGGANSSLLTCNAWDRDRLGWKPDGSVHRIRAQDLQGHEVDADLDPIAGDTGVFVLRDFMTTGDALRIRLPFLPEGEYPQWIWLENHQTFARNGIPSDRFHYEEGSDCVRPAVPGVHAFLQVARDDRAGSNIFSGHADYLRPLVASGHFDLGVRDEEQAFNCIAPGTFRPLVRNDDLPNPLTGNHDLEFPAHDQNQDGQIEQREQLMLRLEEYRGTVYDEAPVFGHSRQVFTPQGNARIGMDTNPSLNSQLSLVRAHREMNQRRAPDNRVIYLNGLSVTLLEQRTNGDLVVHVRSGDVRLRHDVRWCADSIVMPPLKGTNGHALIIGNGTRLTLDRGLTPTRIDKPDTVNGKLLFNDPTRLTVLSEATVLAEPGGVLDLRNGSALHLMSGAVLTLDPKAKLRVDGSSKVVVHGDAKLTMPAKALRKLEKKKRLVRV